MVEGRHGEQAHGDLLLALDRLCQGDATRDICPLLSRAVSLQCARDEIVHHVPQPFLVSSSRYDRDGRRNVASADDTLAFAFGVTC